MSRRRQQRRASNFSEKGEGAARVETSSRPAKKGSERSWLQKGVLVVVVLLLVLSLVSYLWVRGYLRSEKFRHELGAQMGTAVGGTAEVGPIEWQGTAMDVQDLRLQSPRAGNWQLRDIETKIDFSKFWEKIWVVPKIEIRQARSEWDFRNQEKTESDQASAKSSPTSSKKKSGFLPNRTEVHQVLVRDYEGEVLTEEGSFTWDGVQLQSEPHGQRATLIELEGGRLQTPFDWLGSLKLDSGLLAIREGELSIEQSNWMAEAGPMSFSANLVGPQRDFEISVVEWDVKSLLPAEWATFLAGEMTGKLAGTGSNLSGQVEVENGTVKGLPFINRLAAYAGTPRLRRLSFEKAQASFERTDDEWVVQEILLFDEGLLRVEGNLSSRPQGPAGQLSVGVPPGLLAHIPGAEEKVFLPGQGGMLWADVVISGTWEHPKEDLSERLIRAAGERMFEMIPETGQYALRFGTKALDQGTVLLMENQGLVLEQGSQVAEEVIEQSGEVVEEGLRTGFGILNGILGGEE